MAEESGKYFPPQGIHLPEGAKFDNCACVESICDKAGEEWEFEVMTIRN